MFKLRLLLLLCALFLLLAPSLSQDTSLPPTDPHSPTTVNQTEDDHSHEHENEHEYNQDHDDGHDHDSCDGGQEEEYNMGLHIAGIFVIMAASLFGALVPVIIKLMPDQTFIRWTLVCAKMFGTGVILSTAFVHMFCPADQMLTNKCLPAFWNDHDEGYVAFAGMFAVCAVVFTHFFQVMIAIHLGKHLHKSEGDQKPSNPESHSVADSAHGHSHDLTVFSLSTKEKQLTTWALELGIASHSVIVGVALGTAREEFKTLLIALSFHQFFEGLALSSVVLESDFKSWVVKMAMIIIYSLTTPIGVVIGIGVHSAYNDNATASLISQGILDSISAGILLYDCLVNIITPHFSSPAFKNDTFWRQLLQFCFLWFGAGIMAFLGKYA